ncbi:MAG TPA: formyltetrahydrofolate deformylase [Bacteroidales bacterium]|mgnify:FL=1|nr:MAG: Formyltetrahydrofolate deformylase [Bacteroidetes bacterium ADurb.Bin217]HOS85031.1 formyltetrahydrofolate deformylase [Bacteroidales bacterium]HPH16322.1 formyltetrahydrofolate deformylase [Bacteroidales bacterium]HPM12225.1 formyltetrahydrofolate deformylase [Bacteroidales bacterium]
MNTHNSANTATLLIHCKDQKGIVVSVTEFIHKNNGNILYLDQHVDHQEAEFFMRVQWDLDGFAIPVEKIGDYFTTLIGDRYNMKFEIHLAKKVPRIAIFVSHLPHCIYDILSRVRSGEWKVEIPVIVSNHEKLRHVAEEFGIPFHVFSITETNKREQEEAIIKLLQEQEVDTVILARYMQIISDWFISQYPNQIINIHHSFLPAFPGARPYHSAYERGVKLIGATSHYVTPELDAGPIIAQGVTEVTHKDTVENMKRKGLDLEKIVLSKAIWSHIQHKTLVYNNKTIVFE